MPAFTLSLFLLLIIPTQAQDNQTPTDAAPVRTTVTNYIEAYYTGDAARMQQTLHPHYLKHMIHGNIPMRDKTGPQMVREEVLSNGIPDIPQAQRTKQVIVLDVAGTIASAKLVTPGWLDYVTLSKLDGEWKILSVVQRIDN